MRYLISFLIICSIFPISISHAQEEEEDGFTTISTPLTLDLEKRNSEEEEFTPKKKKPKKNFYYGFKTKKGFTTRGRGDKKDLILFNYLKKPQKPDPYVRDIYWYSFERKQIMRTRRYDPEKGVLLHGPYSVTRNEVIIEEGIFYIGTKHGRWVRKTTNDILIDKQKYYKGWPKESLVRYYDPNTRTRIKEIIPVDYGKKEGNYFYFFENGSIAVSGEYANDVKVGKWTSYHQGRNGRREREIQFRKNWYNDDFRPYIRKEWNAAGKVVYDRAKDKVIPQ